MRNAISITLIVLIAATPVWSDSRTLRWNDLADFMTNRPVAMTLPDGARIEGKTTAVEPDLLVIDVRKTSDPATHPMGRQSIPRAQAKTFVVNRPTVRWRIVGTLVGAAAGVPLGAVAALEKDGLFGRGKGTGIVVAAVAGLAGVGFLIGWAADRRKTTVTVAAEASPE